jgi:hypothetical protein
VFQEYRGRDEEEEEVGERNGEEGEEGRRAGGLKEREGQFF